MPGRLIRSISFPGGVRVLPSRHAGGRDIRDPMLCERLRQGICGSSCSLLYILSALTRVNPDACATRHLNRDQVLDRDRAIFPSFKNLPIQYDRIGYFEGNARGARFPGLMTDSRSNLQFFQGKTKLIINRVDAQSGHRLIKPALGFLQFFQPRLQHLELRRVPGTLNSEGYLA